MAAKPLLLPFLQSILLSVLLINVKGEGDFTIEEDTIESFQRAFDENKFTSLQLVDFYLNRIQNLNPVLRCVLEINPDARVQAEEADRERRSNRHHRRSFMHGIPVLLKDSINTNDKMNTTAGSYALLGSVAGRDAGVVEKLRKAGAVILGKASLTEWYSFRAVLKMRNGWCARGGQAQNPYVAGGDTCGSSSGSAISVAANMVSVSLGSETHGSILCPADYNSVVGFKPTVGLTSRAGVIPVSPRQDTIGPMARTVADAVHLLDAIVGFDPRDSEATSDAARFIPDGGYKQFLNEYGIIGKRLGVIRRPFLDTMNRSIVPTFENHLDLLRARGATIIDDLQIPNIDIISDFTASGELMLMQAEFKSFLNEYLNELTISSVRSLADIIEFNQMNPELEKLEEYGQHTFIESEKTNGIGEKERQAAEYLDKLSKDGFEKVMKDHNLDALVSPGISLSMTVLAIGGYPGISVPAGYQSNGMPFGICFGGLKGSEPKLIEVAYAFEQATRIRKPPFSESLDLNRKFNGRKIDFGVDFCTLDNHTLPWLLLSEQAICSPDRESHPTPLLYSRYDHWKDPTAVLVARPSFTTAFNNTPIPFGSVFATDDPLTVGPNLTTSGVIGNAQGLWASTGQDVLTLVVYSG